MTDHNILFWHLQAYHKKSMMQSYIINSISDSMKDQMHFLHRFIKFFVVGGVVEAANSIGMIYFNYFFTSKNFTNK